MRRLATGSRTRPCACRQAEQGRRPPDHALDARRLSELGDRTQQRVRSPVNRRTRFRPLTGALISVAAQVRCWRQQGQAAEPPPDQRFRKVLEGCRRHGRHRIRCHHVPGPCSASFVKHPFNCISFAPHFRRPLIKLISRLAAITIRNRHHASCCQPFSAWQSQDLWPLAAGFPGELHRRWRERPEETRSNGTGRRGRNRAPRNQNPREAEASLSRFPLSRRLQGFGPDLSGRWTVGGQIAERWN